MSDEKDYEVGYGKPPKLNRFRKGQSGNPKGRKPRIKNASTLLSIELDKLILVRDGGKELRLSKCEALMTSLVNDAITNRPNARALLLKLMVVSPPAEPFVPNEDDEIAIEEFLARTRLVGSNREDPEQGSGDEEPA